jgi:hypothetical protein
MTLDRLWLPLVNESGIVVLRRPGEEEKKASRGKRASGR